MVIDLEQEQKVTLATLDWTVTADWPFAVLLVTVFNFPTSPWPRKEGRKERSSATSAFRVTSNRHKFGAKGRELTTPKPKDRSTQKRERKREKKTWECGVIIQPCQLLKSVGFLDVTYVAGGLCQITPLILKSSCKSQYTEHAMCN